MTDVDLGTYVDQWKEATAGLEWYEQRAFKDVLKQTMNEDLELVYGTDYQGTGACLVNSAKTLTRGGRGLPSTQFGPVVAAFDQANREFRNAGINSDNHVSVEAAKILHANFAPLKRIPKSLTGETDAVNEKINAALKRPGSKKHDLR